MSFLQPLLDAIAPHKAEIYKHNGRSILVHHQSYETTSIQPVSNFPTLELSTLDGLVSYLSANIDDLSLEESMVVVESPEIVSYVLAMEREQVREKVVKVQCLESSRFVFGKWYSHEEFIIAALSNFAKTPTLDSLLTKASTILINDSKEIVDDGLTQQAKTRKGISFQEMSDLPSRVNLKPFRTFPEVEQPESEFIFRVRDNDGIQCLLKASDGDRWRLEAMRNIKEHLEKRLEKLNISVIV